MYYYYYYCSLSCAVQANLEMVHKLVLGVKDVQQMLASFLVHSVYHLVEYSIQVLHKHRLN